MRNLRTLCSPSWLDKTRRPVLSVAVFFLCVSTISTYAQNQQSLKEAASIPTAAEIAQSGIRAGSEYRNPLLQFSISVPPQWNFASEEMNRKLLDDGNAKLKANETKARQEAFDKSIANSAVLFSLTPFPLGDSRNTGNFACGYERTSMGALAYARANRDLLLAKSSAARLIKDTYSLKIGAADLQAFDLGSAPNGVAISQVFYMVARPRGILFCVATWLDGADEQRKAMDAIMKSSKFDEK